jgi:hypothetical protein
VGGDEVWRRIRRAAIGWVAGGGAGESELGIGIGIDLEGETTGLFCFGLKAPSFAARLNSNMSIVN